MGQRQEWWGFLLFWGLIVFLFWVGFFFPPLVLMYGSDSLDNLPLFLFVLLFRLQLHWNLL